MAEMKPFEVIMKVSPIAGMNGKTGEVLFRSERQQELVRCEDCFHYDGQYCIKEKMTARHREFFCAYGEREEHE